MTIRRRLDITLLALIAVFLGASAFSLWAVKENANETRAFAWMRQQAQFTADVRTYIYQRLATGVDSIVRAAHGAESQRAVLDDIGVQINLATSERERGLWQDVQSCVTRLDQIPPGAAVVPDLQDLVQQAEQHLRELRDYYDLAQYQSIVRAARTSLVAQVAISIAALLTVLLFVSQMLVVRKWLVAPIEVLKNSAETIGRGRLEHRVPLRGNDELAQLARGIDAMAQNLAHHQTALLATRELSALGELCAHVAHGLKNPLAALKTSAQLAERQAAGSPELTGLIHEMTQQADRLNQRITRLFEFSKPLEMRPGKITFRDLAAAAQAHAQPALRTRGVALRIDDRTQDCVWQFDAEQLGQALAELITNAAHHSLSGGTVEVVGEQAPPVNGSGEQLRVRVADKGAGMSAATQAKVFDLFFTTRPEGTGIGLAMVRKFVERSSGQIEIDSSPGAGTTVTVTFPSTSPSHPAPD